MKILNSILESGSLTPSAQCPVGNVVTEEQRLDLWRLGKASRRDEFSHTSGFPGGILARVRESERQESFFSRIYSDILCLTFV